MDKGHVITIEGRRDTIDIFQLHVIKKEGKTKQKNLILCYLLMITQT